MTPASTKQTAKQNESCNVRTILNNKDINKEVRKWLTKLIC